MAPMAPRFRKRKLRTISFALTFFFESRCFMILFFLPARANRNFTAVILPRAHFFLAQKFELEAEFAEIYDNMVKKSVISLNDSHC